MIASTQGWIARDRRKNRFGLAKRCQDDPCARLPASLFEGVEAVTDAPCSRDYSPICRKAAAAARGVSTSETNMIAPKMEIWLLKASPVSAAVTVPDMKISTGI